MHWSGCKFLCIMYNTININCQLYFHSDRFIKLDRECRKDEEGLTYLGTQSRTRFNTICQRWTGHVPHDHVRRSADLYPDGSIQAAENFCRNTKFTEVNFEDPVWCLTMNASIRYEACYIPECGKI